MRENCGAGFSQKGRGPISSTIPQDQKKRSCSNCTACCTYLRIESQPGYTTRYDNGEDVAKPAGERCRFLSAEGCSIYDVRPQVCRKFACDWLQGRKGLDRTKDFPPTKRIFSIAGNQFFLSD